VGAVKPVLEFLRELRFCDNSDQFDFTMVLFSRAAQENALIPAIQAQAIETAIIRERHPLDLQVLPQLRDLAGRLQPDLVWTNNTKSHFLVRLSEIDRSAKWIASHHGYTREAWRTTLYNQLDRLSLPHANRVITVCNDFAGQLQRKGVPAHRIRVLRNPIRVSAPVSDAEKQRLRTQLGLTNATVLLSVGRLSREKGHANLLRAMALLRESQGASFRSRLIIVGDGPEQGHLQALCSAVKLNEVVALVGHQADVQPYYAISDVFVLPSHSEGSPNVLLEAMAAGLPTVATAVGGLPEVLSHEVNALLVPKENPSQMANAMRRLLTDSSLRERLCENGKQIVAQHDPQSYCRGILALFQEVLDEAVAT
jgi:glycosyltransferase involved in cell wall biosynthesis